MSLNPEEVEAYNTRRDELVTIVRYCEPMGCAEKLFEVAEAEAVVRFMDS